MTTRSLLLYAILVLIATAAGCAAHQEMQPAPTSTSAMASGSTSPMSGHDLLARKCGGCHAVPSPSKMSEEEWISAIDRMKKRMTLQPAEWDSLTAMAGAEPDTVSR